MTAQPQINRRGWLATWLQKRRRARRGPVLVAVSPALITWKWSNLNPVRWNVYYSSFDGTNSQLANSVDGSVFQYAPDICSAWTFVIGVDGAGNEITARSNTVRPDDAVNPANVIILGSDGHGHLTWTLNFPTEFGFNIYKSNDGVTWGGEYDGANSETLSRDCSGDRGYFRICQSDWDGFDILPYSNVVYSDGL